MTNEERKELVQKVVDRHAAISDVFDDLGRIVGCCAESPLFDGVWDVFELLIETTSALIGDKCEWLAWYINENGSGAKRYEAGFDGQMRRIGSVDDLLWLIDLESEDAT